MTPPTEGQAPRAYETLLATIRQRCPEAEVAMAAHVRAALDLLLPRFQGLTVTERQVDDRLYTLVEGVVTWQLANSESWGQAEDARRPAIEVLARVVVGRASNDVRRVLLRAARN